MTAELALGLIFAGTLTLCLAAAIADHIRLVAAAMADRRAYRRYQARRIGR